MGRSVSSSRPRSLRDGLNMNCEICNKEITNKTCFIVRRFEPFFQIPTDVFDINDPPSQKYKTIDTKMCKECKEIECSPKNLEMD